MNPLPTRIPLQNLTAVYAGVTLDQDGNRYADAITKHDFLTECLEQGIRSGNLQPINTVNQLNDLVARINETARQCGREELPAGVVAAHEARIALRESEHETRMRYFRFCEQGYADRGAELWRKIDSMTVAEMKARME